MKNKTSEGATMSSLKTQRTGGQILVEALLLHEVDTVFCVPGESFLSALDALYEHKEKIELFTCRHESGATHMAEAYGKITGKPGISFVTRGPGATNASIAVHTASQDSTPLILFIGQVPRNHARREAWQEIDYRAMFSGIAKWVDQIDHASRIPEFIARAFHIATSGRPGPVVLALPEDMLVELSNVSVGKKYTPTWPAPTKDQVAHLQTILETSKRPLVLLGGGGWSAEACKNIETFIKEYELPVACSFRRQDLIDNQNPFYIGETGLGINPNLKEIIRKADTILAIGTRLGEISTQGYEIFEVPLPTQKLIHVHADVNELGRVYQPELPIASGMNEISIALSSLKREDFDIPWQKWAASARESYLRFINPETVNGGRDLAEIIVYLSQHLPPDSIITNGAGNYTLWVQRFYQYKSYRTQLAPTSGSMGYGIPAAIAAKIIHPKKTVVCFAGDGCFLMSSQELATAVQYNLKPIFVVINNGTYGSIRMHQEFQYPQRVHGTDLKNPNFINLAKAYGLYAESIENLSDFQMAFERALNAGRAALIEIKLDRLELTPDFVLSNQA